MEMLYPFLASTKKTVWDEYAKAIYTSLTINETLSELMRSACIYKIRISDSISLYISLIFDCLYNLADLYDTTLEECLNIAYNEIKDRTGRIINRKFIKDKQDE